MRTQTILIVILLVLIGHLAPAQWIQTNGPYGGDIMCLTVSGTDLYAGIRNAGIFRSTDGGEYWTEVSSGLTSLSMEFLASGGAGVYAVANGRLFRLTGNGSIWVRADSGLTNRRVKGIALRDTLIFACTSLGVYLSADSGVNWRQVNSVIRPWHLEFMDMLLFAATDSGVFRSTDDGASWTLANSGLPHMNKESDFIAVIDTNVIAKISAGVFLSTDRGIDWRLVDRTLIFPTDFTGMGADLFAATSAGVFRSTDFGRNWTPANSGLTTTVVECLAVRGTDFFAGTTPSTTVYGSNPMKTGPGGVFRSTDMGASWAPVNSGLAGTRVSNLKVSGMRIFAATSGCGFTSSDNGTRWTPLTSALSDIRVYDFAVMGNTLFAGNEAGLYRSSDNGMTWSSITSSIKLMSFAVIDSELYAIYSQTVFRSTDMGTSWIACAGLPQPSRRGNAVIGTNLFLGTTTGSIIRSTDHGAAWMKADSGIAENADIYSLASSADKLFAGSLWRGVFRSVDLGLHWSSVNAGLTDTAVSALVVSGKSLFAATYGCYFLSTDDGMRWTSIDGPLPNTETWALAVDGTNMFAGVGSRGVWTRRLSEMMTSSEPTASRLPRESQLQQNYPNPFNPTTVVSYQLSVVSDVKLAVYDILGREVAVLVNEKKAPGRYEVTFDGSGLASGVYFYRLRAGDPSTGSGRSFVQTRKLILVR